MTENRLPLDALFDAAKKVRDHAHAPYSKFRVGAALHTNTGRLFTGCNVENAAAGSGLCAEASAVAAMVAAGERQIRDILICADCIHPVLPCGNCLQIIREFTHGPVQVYGADLVSIKVHHTLDSLLPHSFGAHHLAD